MSKSIRVPAKKSLGQHFLTDRNYLARIADAAGLTPADVVLEIGPGTGGLTRELAARAGHVVAVELDDRLIDPLRQAFAGQPAVTVVHGDILDLNPAELVASWAAMTLPHSGGAVSDSSREGRHAYKVVANLPYYITSAALRRVLEATPPPTQVVVLVQWEVAERIVAKPGDLSLLAVSVQYYAEPELVARVPATAFSPRPKVDSAILRLAVRPQPAVAVSPAVFFAVVAAGFGQRRKQLLNSLAGGLHLPKETTRAWLVGAAIDPTRRAETLTLDEWGRLCQTLPPALSGLPTL
jgi:16S rRNA (adenine1518-N6/adenine1519-N6)-dimethyltransferase